MEENSEISVNRLILKNFKLIYVINLLSFIFLNIANLILVILTEINGSLGITYLLPGTGIESSLPLNISAISLPIIIFSPLMAILLFYLIYKKISNINFSELTEKLQLLSESRRNYIIETLKKINQKYYRDLSSE